MKILITGSAGFIGSALKDYLSDNKIEVTPFDIKDDPKYDVRDFKMVNKYASDVKGIIHLAAMSRVITAQEQPHECISTNIGGVSNILEAARRNDNHPWIIFGSSREVFGEPEILPVLENSPKKPINIYGLSKITGEKLCEIYSRYYGLKIRILRFSNVYTGVKDHLDRVIPKFILRALNDQDLYINGSGEEQFDFTYISDVIQGIWGCIKEIEKNKKSLDDFNLSIGTPVSLRQLAEIIIKKVKSKSKIEFNESRKYDVNHFYGSPEKAKKYLKFSPSISIGEGLDLAIQELKNIDA
ncbi:MAG: NAD-dependent epimerase/dehydratase family protein [Promethearchaeota archaeon]|nr:MAG: NAD-dependent epimerase/dehydratase family protein [Candidatus Lokiarchaeota archaeon]